MTGVIKVFGSNIPTLGLVRAISRRPMIVTFQFDYAGLAERTWGRGHPRGRLARFLERAALMPADLVFVTTAALERKVREIYRRPTVLLPNWFDDEAVPDATAKRDIGLVVYAGRLHPVKGVDVLVRAFAGVRAERPDAHLVILGAGEGRARLVTLAASLGIEPGVFKDSVSNTEVLSWLARADVFVLPTVSMEGHPKALVEAMACGAACVATDIPGNRDLVEDSECGLLVPPRDDRALACAILRLLGDDDLRRRLGDAARRRVSGLRFRVIVSRELDILQRVHRSTSAPAIAVSGAETDPPGVSRDE
jgi:glycosyltransferase involved in cell wall biosynthesis